MPGYETGVRKPNPGRRSDTFITMRDLISLGMIASMAQRNAKIVRVLADRSEPIYGTARSIGDERGNFTPSDGNVLNEYLRVTTRDGWEEFWPVTDLMDAIEDGTFAETDR
jgi:hypothetical protein